METVMDQFIDDHYRYRLFFYQTILISEGQIHYSQVEEILDIKKQKISGLITDLNTDFQTIGLSIKIKIKGKESIIINKFSQLDYQLLRMYYFKKSTITALLIEVGFLQKYTIQEFADKLFFSKSKMYNLSHELNRILENWDIKLTSYGLKGNEQKIRSFFFQVLYYFYSSHLEQLPDFLTKNNKSVNGFLNDLQLMYKVIFTINQHAQLNLILQIQLYRISQGHIIKNEEWNFKIDMDYSKIFLKFLKSSEVLDNLYNTELEANYFYLFVVSNRSIITTYDNDWPNPELYEMFYNYVFRKYPEILAIISLTTLDKLKLLCFRWSNLAFSLASFISKNQFSFFQQSFPTLHELIYEFVIMVDSNRKNGLMDYEKPICIMTLCSVY